MKKRNLFHCMTPYCPREHDELMEKYTAVCKERDERKASVRELEETLIRTVGFLHQTEKDNKKLRETLKQIRELVKKYEGEGGSL